MLSSFDFLTSSFFVNHISIIIVGIAKIKETIIPTQSIIPLKYKIAHTIIQTSPITIYNFNLVLKLSKILPLYIFSKIYHCLFHYITFYCLKQQNKKTKTFCGFSAVKTHIHSQKEKHQPLKIKNSQKVSKNFLRKKRSRQLGHCSFMKNKRAIQFALLRRGCTSANLIELFSYKWSVGLILSL